MVVATSIVPFRFRIQTASAASHFYVLDLTHYRPPSGAYVAVLAFTFLFRLAESTGMAFDLGALCGRQEEDSEDEQKRKSAHLKRKFVAAK